MNSQNQIKRGRGRPRKIQDPDFKEERKSSNNKSSIRSKTPLTDTDRERELSFMRCQKRGVGRPKRDSLETYRAFEKDEVLSKPEKFEEYKFLIEQNEITLADLLIEQIESQNEGTVVNEEIDLGSNTVTEDDSTPSEEDQKDLIGEPSLKQLFQELQESYQKTMDSMTNKLQDQELIEDLSLTQFEDILYECLCLLKNEIKEIQAIKVLLKVCNAKQHSNQLFKSLHDQPDIQEFLLLKLLSSLELLDNNDRTLALKVISQYLIMYYYEITQLNSFEKITSKVFKMIKNSNIILNDPFCYKVLLKICNKILVTLNLGISQFIEKLQIYLIIMEIHNLIILMHDNEEPTIMNENALQNYLAIFKAIFPLDLYKFEPFITFFHIQLRSIKSHPQKKKNELPLKFVLKFYETYQYILKKSQLHQQTLSTTLISLFYVIFDNLDQLVSKSDDNQSKIELLKWVIMGWHYYLRDEFDIQTIGQALYQQLPKEQPSQAFRRNRQKQLKQQQEQTKNEMAKLLVNTCEFLNPDEQKDLLQHIII